MTVKLVVLYTQPDDPDVFERHYAGTQMPMVCQIPGLQRTESGRFIAEADGGEATFYRTAALYFADRTALDQALATREAQAVAADFEKIAPPGSRMLVENVDA